MGRNKRLLVANRGEIAARILSTARELDLHTIAIYTSSDQAHISHAHEAVELPNVSSFLDVVYLIQLCQKLEIDLVHPGYGFLSESYEFAEQLEAASILFVGPSADILRKTGDKLSARQLAEACKVPVLPAMTDPTGEVARVREFGRKAGWPIMIKAVDGGGGRGIRLVRSDDELESNFQRAVSESPSKLVFAEQAAVGGWRHIEVQILGDGQVVRHFWERECSIQRRYQKVVEIAPSTNRNCTLIASVIESALKMAKSINYKSLGTFEFLLSPEKSAFYFMEINPRIQVEHTITESLTSLDLVQLQLLIAQGSTLFSLNLPIPPPELPPPSSTSIQLRVTAEDPRHNFSLSVGRINGFSLPAGNGVRVDSHIDTGVIVSSDFDSLLAKIIVTGRDHLSAINKALRALEDLSIEGISTNTALLRGILHSDAFRRGGCDTQWLEQNLGAILSTASTSPPQLHKQPTSTTTASSTALAPSSSTLALKKGDSFSLSLTPPPPAQPLHSTFTVTKLLRNDFPTSLAAELSLTSPPQSTSEPYTLQISQSSSTLGTSFSSPGARLRPGDPKNPSHLICPLAGQLVEVLVDDGDLVEEFEAVAVIRQMKMELEVRAHRRGLVTGLWEVEEGEEVGAGVLVCEILREGRVKGKL